MKIRYFTFAIFFMFLMQAIFASSGKAPIEDDIKMTRYFKNIAITSVASYGSDGTFAGYKLLIRPVIFHPENFKPFHANSDKPRHELGKPFWIITGQQLPATEETCYAANADPCDSNPADPFNTCYNSCVTYGPQFLFYDKNKKDLYILATTADCGQGGGMMLVYVANIETKTIRFLRPIPGWVAATLSPSGKYLAFYGLTAITIYNLDTKKDIEIIKKNIWTKEKEKLHSLSIMSWINDNQFIYRDNIYHSKFQEDWDAATEYAYDISLQKNIKRKTLSKSEQKMDSDDNNSASVPLS